VRGPCSLRADLCRAGATPRHSRQSPVPRPDPPGLGSASSGRGLQHQFSRVGPPPTPMLRPTVANVTYEGSNRKNKKRKT
jgi:hypothetical protein